MRLPVFVFLLALAVTAAGGSAAAPVGSSGRNAEQAAPLFWRSGDDGRYKVLLWWDSYAPTFRAAFACWSPQTAAPSRLLARVFFPRSRWRYVRGRDVRQPDRTFRIRGRGVGGPATMTGRLSHIPRGNRAPLSILTGTFRSGGCYGGKTIRYRISGRCANAACAQFRPPPRLVVQASFRSSSECGLNCSPLYVGEAVAFRAKAVTTSGDVVREYRWDFGVPNGVVLRRSSDDEYGPDPDVEFTYRSPASVVVELRVTSRRGVTATVRRAYEVTAG